MGDTKISIQLRIDEITHKKAKYIADKKLRSLNSQLEYFILKEIEEYEKNYGSIELTDKK